MNKQEREQFVEDLIANVKDGLLRAVDRLPAEWDGHELRQLVADRFAEVSWALKNNKKRLKDYRNFMNTHSL